MDETKAGLLADLRAKRDHYNAVEGNDDSMEHLLEALDAFLDAPAPSQPTPEARVELEALRAAKDSAYAERNRCVALIAKMALALGWRAGVRDHEDKPGETWEPDWRSLVCIDLPTGQVTWHFHDSERLLLTGMPVYPASWDGHDTAEKYRRVNDWLPALPLPESALLTKAAPRNETYTEYVKRTTAAPLTQPAVPEKEVVHPAASSDERDRLAGTATPGVTLKDAKEGVAPVHIEVECPECNASFAVDRDGDGAPAPVETREPLTKENP